MKDETGVVAIEEFVRLKPKMYSFLLDSSNIKKQKAWIKMLLQQLVIMNIKKYCWIINVWDIQRIKFKIKIIGTYEINNISLSCFDDKIYIQNNEYDGLALGY